MKFDITKYHRGSVIKFPYPCGSEKTNCSSYDGFLFSGVYKFDVYGAEGGRAYNNSGGYGGYSTGILTIKELTKVYIFVGAQGPSTSSAYNAVSKAAFNVGGTGKQSKDKSYIASSGGGSSDIRLLSNDIYHRLIVAGGGGGSGYYTKYLKGGDGGGENGGNGTIYSGSVSVGASQTSGDLLNGKSITITDGCGGGGGLFGGNNGYSYNNAGAGGSGYVFTSNSASATSAAKILLSSEYYLTSANTSISNHLGDGMIEITVMEINKRVFNMNTCRCTKYNRHIYFTALIVICS